MLAHDEEPSFDSEEVISERDIEPFERDDVDSNPRGPTNMKTRSLHTKPSTGGGEATAVLTIPARITTVAPNGFSPQVESIRQAKAKGYEGDPCTNCGMLTLVRSGACMRCDACGQTTGCG